ncbi:hypothetical protein EY643_15370 [Halioglobus maricola]|uniref:Uncharacterized protein n=1 Tax=Halioglobus maricola TaxID=2601894 RepID=A0A5P9NM70_9GAMM|nr:hypothetical protein [Halioglobus maricola]QFU76920.1 hypothetical protein EY643_15370 [Halioglobus maricola]
MRYSPVLLVAFALFANAQTTTTSRADYCTSISSYAERIMLARQAGQPKESQLQSLALYFTQESEQAAAAELIDEAWKGKQASTERRQQIKTNRFRENVEEDCLKNKIFPN